MQVKSVTLIIASKVTSLMARRSNATMQPTIKRQTCNQKILDYFTQLSY